MNPGGVTSEGDVCVSQEKVVESGPVLFEVSRRSRHRPTRGRFTLLCWIVKSDRWTIDCSWKVDDADIGCIADHKGLRIVEEARSTVAAADTTH